MLTLEQGRLVYRRTVAIARDVEPKTPATIAGDVRKDNVPHGVVCVGKLSFQFPPEFWRYFFLVVGKFLWIASFLHLLSAEGGGDLTPKINTLTPVLKKSY